MAAKEEDRESMLIVAKAFDSGERLGNRYVHFDFSYSLNFAFNSDVSNISSATSDNENGLKVKMAMLIKKDNILYNCNKNKCRGL